MTQSWIGRWKAKLVVRYQDKEADKKREMGKKRSCKLIQDDSLHPRREGNTGEALCLGHRRTHSLNTVMEWNSWRLSHYKAPCFHHSSFLSLPPPLFLIKIFQVTHGFQMCCSLAAAEQLVTLSCLPSFVFSSLFLSLLSSSWSHLVAGYSLSFPSVVLFLPPCSKVPTQPESQGTDYALCKPLKINEYVGS